MTKNDVIVVLEILNDRADKLKDKVFCLRKADEKMSLLLNELQNSNLSDDFKFSLTNIMIMQQWDYAADIDDLNSKIDSIDNFVGTVRESLNGNDDYLLYFELEE